MVSERGAICQWSRMNDGSGLKTELVRYSAQVLHSVLCALTHDRNYSTSPSFRGRHAPFFPPRSPFRGLHRRTGRLHEFRRHCLSGRHGGRGGGGPSRLLAPRSRPRDGRDVHRFVAPLPKPGADGVVYARGGPAGNGTHRGADGRGRRRLPVCVHPHGRTRVYGRDRTPDQARSQGLGGRHARGGAGSVWAGRFYCAAIEPRPRRGDARGLLCRSSLEFPLYDSVDPALRTGRCRVRGTDSP